uniref:Uncharacterized protein n=1 Tax=Aegilops tauschii subsp. strangulata TaxID=200361 RepID=A0A453NFC8_AEGTS
TGHTCQRHAARLLARLCRRCVPVAPANGFVSFLQFSLLVSPFPPSFPSTAGVVPSVRIKSLPPPPRQSSSLRTIPRLLAASADDRASYAMAMDRRARAAPRADEERPSHGRFLRPGALARLRDSRIVA